MSKASLVKMTTKKAQKVLEQINEMDPVYSQKGDFDVEHAFQLYSSFTGDVQRTAFALNVKPQVVIEMAKEFGWDEKLSAIFDLKRSGKPGDVEKCLSRAINFCQAHRMRIVLERMVSRLYAMSADELMDECTTTGKDGARSLNTRPLSDLCAALDKVHTLTYLALSDSITERSRRQDNGDSEVSLGSIHQIISQAMTDTTNSAKREQFAAKLAQAQAAQTPKPDASQSDA